MEIIIIGAGQFGTALNHHFTKNGFNVHVVGRSSPWPSEVSKKSIVVICVPTQNLPELIAQRATEIAQVPVVVSTCKGLLQDSLLTPSRFLSQHLKNVAVLSGPSLSVELEENLPAALVVASKNPKLARSLCRELSCGNLRLYSNNDPLGVEYCGALKNIYAILDGVCEGLHLGENARASLNTRALAELSRFVGSFGGRHLTVFGLAGAGDLFLTCSSHQSRNFRFGMGLAQQKSSADLIQKLGTVEGYWTAFAALKLARKRKVRTPLIKTAVELLDGKVSFEQAFKNLISRKTRSEFD